MFLCVSVCVGTCVCVFNFAWLRVVVCIRFVRLHAADLTFPSIVRAYCVLVRPFVVNSMFAGCLLKTGWVHWVGFLCLFVSCFVLRYIVNAVVCLSVRQSVFFCFWLFGQLVGWLLLLDLFAYVLVRLRVWFPSYILGFSIQLSARCWLACFAYCFRLAPRRSLAIYACTCVRVPTIYTGVRVFARVLLCVRCFAHAPLACLRLLACLLVSSCSWLCVEQLLICTAARVCAGVIRWAYMFRASGAVVVQ